MTFTTFMTWIVVAVVTGLAASILVRDGSHGTMADVRLAVAGGGLASAGAAFALQRKFFYPSLG